MYNWNALTASLFAIQSSAVDYTIHSSQDEFTCSNANNNDKCIIYCDEDEGKGDLFNYSFDCGNAGICQFNCAGNKCLNSGTLTASNSNNLNVLSSASECLKSATINVPNYGDATFTMSAEKSFKNMTVNTGTNTNNILIDCTFGNSYSDECKQMTVNAQTSQYLEITVGKYSELIGHDSPDDTKDDFVIINCPINSNYNGPQIASCIIDLSHGGLLENAIINTLNGMPNDLWIYTGDIQLDNVKINCNNGYSINIGNSFSGECTGATMHPITTSFSTSTNSVSTNSVSTNSVSIMKESIENSISIEQLRATVGAKTEQNIYHNVTIHQYDSMLIVIIVLLLAIICCIIGIGIFMYRKVKKNKIISEGSVCKHQTVNSFSNDKEMEFEMNEIFSEEYDNNVGLNGQNDVLKETNTGMNDEEDILHEDDDDYEHIQTTMVNGENLDDEYSDNEFGEIENENQMNDEIIPIINDDMDGDNNNTAPL